MNYLFESKDSMLCLRVKTACSVLGVCVQADFIMKLEIFEIRFDIPRGVYAAGDQVKGNVVLRLRNPMKVRSKFFSLCACVTLDFCVCFCACVHVCE